VCPCPGLKFFRLNNYSIIIVFFFVFSNMQIALSMLASTIFSHRPEPPQVCPRPPLALLTQSSVYLVHYSTVLYSGHYLSLLNISCSISPCLAPCCACGLPVTPCAVVA